MDVIKNANIQFDATINYMSHMVFGANQEQNKTYTSKDMLKRKKKSFNMEMLKERCRHTMNIGIGT